MQITTCGTYRFRLWLPAACPVFFNESGVAPNILGIVLAVALFVLGPRAIGFLLVRVHALKIVRMSRSPLLIGLAFLLVATFFLATGFLSFSDSRIWCK